MPITRKVVTDPTTNEPLLSQDGRVRTEVTVSGEGDGLACAVLTGPVGGVVRMDDGTLYDVSPDVITVDPKHSMAIGFRCVERMAELGTLDTFVHGPGYSGPAVVLCGSEGYHWLAHEGDDLSVPSPKATGTPEEPADSTE